jgi:hypothetical protein
LLLYLDESRVQKISAHTGSREELEQLIEHRLEMLDRVSNMEALTSARIIIEGAAPTRKRAATCIRKLSGRTHGLVKRVSSSVSSRAGESVLPRARVLRT